MKPGLNRRSLFSRLSLALNVWSIIFGLLVVLISALFIYRSVNEIFHNQANQWVESFPRTAIVNLLDSDYFTLEKNVQLIKNTKLFSEFHVYDQDSEFVAGFGPSPDIDDVKRLPILDRTRQSWGTFTYTVNHEAIFNYVGTYVAVVATFLLLIYLLQMQNTTRILRSKQGEFDQFLEELQNLKEHLSDIRDSSQIANARNFIDIETSDSESQLLFDYVKSLIEEILNLQLRMTDLIQKEQEIKSKEQLSQLATQVAHDIRSPLSALDILIKTKMTKSSEERTLLLGISSRIQGIADQLLKKHRPENSPFTENKTPVPTDVQVLIPQLISQKYLEYPVRNFEIQWDDQTNGICFAAISTIDLSRVLSNLINNAIEAIQHDHGKIVLRTYVVGERITLELKDNGYGIQSNFLSTFYSNERAHSVKLRGHGLGLKGSKTLIESHNGELHIRPLENGNGTLAQVILPLGERPKNYLKSLPRLSGDRICVIDDDPTVANSIATLVGGDTTVISIRDLKEVEKYGPSLNQKFDFFIVDYDLDDPDANGLSIIEKYQLNSKSVLYTSEPFDHLHERLLKMNVDYLQKGNLI
ncbi:MAG: hybrid sensor histidine kinase/response regulator [Bdellovibrionales bacterium]